METNVNKIIKEVFEEFATALETGQIKKRITIGLTCEGSEHGRVIMFEAATIAKQLNLFDIVLITKEEFPGFKCIKLADESEMHNVMEQQLNENLIQGCVTLHYNFPIGVSTVGKVITPAFGKPMYIASTTGTTSTHRVEAMVRNAIAGIIAAKASGVNNPSVGILNVEGANIVQRSLCNLKENGYPITLAGSMRSDGACIMRGNDLLSGHFDVLVCDSLTGNIIMKLLSAYHTGGNYEALGYGYGPGIGRNYGLNVCIVSRASGAQVIANAMYYAYELANNNFVEIAREEYQRANKANINEICINITNKDINSKKVISIPKKEVVTESISGIEVTELDYALNLLWEKNIYAESGMGCTGPVIMVNKNNFQEALKIIEQSELN